MSFISWQYLLFLPLIFLLYWVLSGRKRLLLLLAASYVFYGCWDVRFLALVLATTVIDFLCGLSIDGIRTTPLKALLLALLPASWTGVCFLALPAAGISPGVLGVAAGLGMLFFAAHEALWAWGGERRRRYFLFLSVGFCLTILGFFKYFGFFVESARSLLEYAGLQPGPVLLKIILPVGISFYTFQSLGYVFDIYRGVAPACRDFITFAVFDAFFPQMVSGPIERGHNLIPQLSADRRFQPAYLQDGLSMMLVGFFKKVFVADNCAVLANYAFAPATHLNGYWAVLGVIAFAFQIYGDFSGYTDIARGSAKLLGIDLVENFRFPYLAQNPSDFWSRWHISLSNWFRDYLYIPLGGNRGGKWQTLRNLGVTMLLAGLWHGASWVFVLWGAYHGALLIVYRFPPLNRLDGKEKGFSGRALVAVPLMWLLVLVGWAIFRSADLNQLWSWLAALAHWQTSLALPWRSSVTWLLIHTVPLILLQLLTLKYRHETGLRQLSWPVKGLVYVVLVFLVVSSSEQDREFIYFQF
ncbi:MAG: MBOAT family protein [Deltaproteobacteria bacterium]|nr:MBOAT family protein [Deltaproteobacteria bacterium]